MRVVLSVLIGTVSKTFSVVEGRGTVVIGGGAGVGDLDGSGGF